MNLFDQQSTEFIRRHIGPSETETQQMLATIGETSTQSLVEKTIPKSIHLQAELDLPASISEQEYLQDIWMTASKNKVYRTYIGQGYYNTITPSDS